MQPSRTFLAIVVLVMLGLLAGSSVVGVSWYTGQVLEENSRGLVDEVNQGMAEFIPPDAEMNASVDSVERGIFGTTMKFSARMHSQKQGRAWDLSFLLHAEHGPFPATRIAEGNFAPVAALVTIELVDTPTVREWFRATGQQVPMSSRIVYAYDGSSQIDLALAPARLSSPTFNVDFSGAEGRTQVGPDGEQVTESSLQFAHLSLDGFLGKDLVQSEIENFRAQGSYRYANGRRSEALDEAEIGKVVLKGFGPNYEILEVGGTSQYLCESSSCSYGIKWSAAAFKADGVDAGATDASLKLDHLDLAAIEELQTRIEEFRITRVDSPGGTSLQRARLLGGLEELLAGSPKVEFESHGRNTGGQTTVKLEVELAKPGNWFDQDPERLVRQLIPRAQLDVAMDRAWLRQAVTQWASTGDVQASTGHDESWAAGVTDSVLNLAVANGIATQQGESFHTSLGYKAGMFAVNGSGASAAQLQGLARKLNDNARSGSKPEGNAIGGLAPTPTAPIAPTPAGPIAPAPEPEGDETLGGVPADSRHGVGSPTGGGPDTHPPEFYAYYGDMVQSIQQHWAWKGDTEGLVATVGFRILADGTIADAAIVERSSNPEFDESALYAVKETGSLTRPPASIADYFAEVQMVFRAADARRIAQSGAEPPRQF